MFRRLVVIAPALDFGGRLAVDAGTAEERGGGVAAGSTLKLKPCFHLQKLRDNATATVTILPWSPWAARHNGSLTLANFVSETVSDSDMRQYLPWPPSAMKQKIETILYLCCVTQGGQFK
jgi:hypothetical protein